MEILDVLDENGNYTGKTEERKIVHESGLWHIHVGVWIMNKKGELLFQKRSMQKKVNPGKWTRTGGHVDSGETPLEAVQRETAEEIGVKIPIDNFKLLSISKEEVDIPKYQVTNRHFIYSYIAIVDYNLEDYTMQQEEVSDLKYITIEQMEEAYKNKDENYTFIRWKNIDNVIEELKKIRKLQLSKKFEKKKQKEGFNLK